MCALNRVRAVRKTDFDTMYQIHNVFASEMIEGPPNSSSQFVNRMES